MVDRHGSSRPVTVGEKGEREDEFGAGLAPGFKGMWLRWLLGGIFLVGLLHLLRDRGVC